MSYIYQNRIPTARRMKGKFPCDWVACRIAEAITMNQRCNDVARDFMAMRQGALAIYGPVPYWSYDHWTRNNYRVMDDRIFIRETPGR